MVLLALKDVYNYDIGNKFDHPIMHAARLLRLGLLLLLNHAHALVIVLLLSLIQFKSLHLDTKSRVYLVGV